MSNQFQQQQQQAIVSQSQCIVPSHQLLHDLVKPLSAFALEGKSEDQIIETVRNYRLSSDYSVRGYKLYLCLAAIELFRRNDLLEELNEKSQKELFGEVVEKLTDNQLEDSDATALFTPAKILHNLFTYLEENSLQNNCRSGLFENFKSLFIKNFDWKTMKILFNNLDSLKNINGAKVNRAVQYEIILEICELKQDDILALMPEQNKERLSWADKIVKDVLKELKQQFKTLVEYPLGEGWIGKLYSQIVAKDKVYSALLGRGETVDKAKDNEGTANNNGKADTEDLITDSEEDKPKRRSGRKKSRVDYQQEVIVGDSGEESEAKTKPEKEKETIVPGQFKYKSILKVARDKRKRVFYLPEWEGVEKVDENNLDNWIVLEDFPRKDNLLEVIQYWEKKNLPELELLDLTE
jgi:hypothetical protein